MKVKGTIDRCDLIVVLMMCLNQELPPTIGHLSALVILNVDRNRLASIPAEVSSILLLLI